MELVIDKRTFWLHIIWDSLFFQVCNSTVEDIFGQEWTKEGTKKLGMVADVLPEWIDFIDGFVGKEDSSNIPLYDVYQKMQTTILTIKENGEMHLP